MIRVTVQLISANTGRTTELGRLEIANDGTGTAEFGNYHGRVMRRPNYRSVTRTGSVTRHSRNQKTIWTLIGRMLESMGYLK